MTVRSRKLNKISPLTWRRILVSAGVIFVSCCVCVGAAAISDATGSLHTPTPTLDAHAIGTDAMQGAQLSNSQTAAALPTIAITSTDTRTSFPTNTSRPTVTPKPIFTSTSRPTETLVVFINTQAAQAVCSCSADTLNCRESDFPSQASAQACYEYCISIGAGDIHGLDGNDEDGVACESLP